MKILKNHRYQFFTFLLIFFIINVLQSRFTALFEDEAYYWVWSKKLAWGYFDHPPLVALWAKISGYFFQGELGIRFLSAVGFSLIIWMTWEMIDLKEKWKNLPIFFMLIVAMALFQIFGFIITPDTPLLLFITLFLVAYKRFLIKDTYINSFVLGISMAAMLYSKYHGVLLIVFVVISNWKLLINPRFWLAGITGIILFIPHLVWQYENGFPSFVYHLQERGKRLYSINNTLTHLLNMLVVVGIAFPVIYKSFYKHQVKNQFEKSLKYIVYGFFLFFLISSFKSQPQAQWLVAITIPLIIICFPYLVANAKPRKWLMILGSIQLFILILARIFMAIPEISPITLEPHLAQQWIPDLKKNTAGKPIVFVNSYQRASLYRFYTGIDTHSYGVLRGRMSQYNLLNFEDNIQGKDVYSASTFIKDQPVLAPNKGTAIYGKSISDYRTFEKVQCLIEEDQILINPGTNSLTFTFINTYDKNINFDHVQFIGVFQGYKNKILMKIPLEITNLKPVAANEEIQFHTTFKVPVMNGDQEITFRIALEFYELLEGFQGNKVPVTIK